MRFFIISLLSLSFIVLSACDRAEKSSASAAAKNSSGSLTAAPPVSGEDTSEARTALVIGVDDYRDAYFPKLSAPDDDARLMAEKLRTLGFEVTLRLNPSRGDLLTLSDEFGQSLARRQGVGLFFFSGHGSMKPDEADPNFLIPAGTRITSREDLPQEAFNAQRVANRMKEAGNRLNLVFLDACRSNDLPSRNKSATAGLASIRGASGLMFFFATQPNEVALEATETSSSVFTDALLAHLATPGLSFMDMMADVTADTERISLALTAGSETKIKQSPFMTGTLSGRFSFAPGVAARPASVPSGPSEEEVQRRIAAAVQAAKTEPPPPQPVVSVPPKAVPVPETPGKGFTNTLGMKFLPVPGTTVQFCIHETRSKDFAAFIADRNRGYTMTDDDWRTYKYKEVAVGRGASESAENSAHPVANVSWLDAVAFCEWLSKKEGKTYRLPTDAEWSKAVGLREGEGTPKDLDAGVKDEYPWGGKFVASAISGNYADDSAKAKDTGFGYIEGYRDGFATTAPVMSFTANQHGLYDLGGNLWEWCAGCYDGTDPSGKNKTLTSSRALRGGSWGLFDPACLLSSGRSLRGPGGRLNCVGFRVVVVAGSGG